eukprot:TRINITY_DN2185_c0_g1_i1.p1 TRINITY_DN2185_c0_g1~~TRINITY_DN2185_c0_g1_i1.p1  ORF type:complete len:77 (+),score=19.56 TRINITY_DN2185_c0_g1_i1:52-282(+)
MSWNFQLNSPTNPFSQLLVFFFFCFCFCFTIPSNFFFLTSILHNTPIHQYIFFLTFLLSFFVDIVGLGSPSDTKKI